MGNVSDNAIVLKVTCGASVTLPADKFNYDIVYTDQNVMISHVNENIPITNPFLNIYFREKRIIINSLHLISATNTSDPDI